MNLLTYAGYEVDFDNFTEADVNIHTIAHGLALTNRWAGQSRFPVSVAQHSITLALVTPQILAEQNKITSEEEYDTIAAVALMHDAAEAYMHDITRSLKPRLSEYQELEEHILQTIFNRYELPYEDIERIKPFDDALGSAEQAQLFANPGMLLVPPLNVEIQEWSWRYAESQFLDAFGKLVEAVYDAKYLV